jgi:transposase
VSDPSIFKSGRELAAWIGLVPKQTSTGGKERMGRISKPIFNSFRGWRV